MRGWADAGRCGQMRADAGRCGQMRADGGQMAYLVGHVREKDKEREEEEGDHSLGDVDDVWRMVHEDDQ